MIVSPDITALLEDADLGAQAFCVFRTKGEWSDETFEFELSEPQQIQGIGNMQPASPRQLAQVAEGDRTSEMLSLRTRMALYLTHVIDANPNEGYVSDELVWRGNRYKVVSVDGWHDFGFCHAILAKMG